MLETGIAQSLAESVTSDILQLKLVTPEKAHKTVFRLVSLCIGQEWEQEDDEGIYQATEAHYSSLNFDVQTERWKSQSLNMGSIRILVSEIFFSMKASSAACCFSLFTSI